MTFGPRCAGPDVTKSRKGAREAPFFVRDVTLSLQKRPSEDRPRAMRSGPSEQETAMRNGSRDPQSKVTDAREPILALTLWPHRSLSRRGFRILMTVLALLAATPLFALIGTTALFIIAGFIALDLLLLWGMIRLSYRSGRVRETVALWPDRLRVERVEPNGDAKIWEANPHWVRVRLLETRRMPDYLVLSSAGRDIELGAFLTPGERRSLAAELRDGLARASAAAGPAPAP